MRKTDAHIKKRKDFSTVMHNIAANDAKQGNPVAVVYYRCELKKDSSGNTYCTPHNCLYYVHNGVALEDLPTKEGRARISHVAQWPATNEVYICGAEEAAKVAEAVKGGQKPATRCCGNSTVNPPTKDNPWRPWVLEAIHPYAVNHQPIAWVVNNETHNGVFKCFKDQQPGSTCDDKITAAGGKGTLHYWHFANPGHEQQGLVEARTAFDPGKFSEQFIQESGDFKIVKQPPPVTDLKPCP